MVEFINKYTGGVMYVDEPRVAKYEALGHTRAAEVIAEVEMTEIIDEPKPTAKRPSRKKRDPKEW